MVNQPGSPSVPTPEQPQIPQNAEPTANFARQVEMYQVNLQRKFGQKALEAGVSLIAFAANMPMLKDNSDFLRAARAVLGTTTAGMLGGDIGRQLGLQKFSTEQGERAQEFLKQTDQFFNEDGSDRTYTDSEHISMSELRYEMAKQLEVLSGAAVTTEHDKLFGRMLDEDLDKDIAKSEGWTKEGLRGISTGVRGLLSRDTLNAAGRLAAKATNPMNLVRGTWQLIKFGAKNWKTVAMMGVPLAATWIAPVMAPVALTGIAVGRKGGELRGIYKAHGQAPERVQAYQHFSVAHIPTIRELAEQLIRLDRAMGNAGSSEDPEALIAEVQKNISQETYQHIAQAVRQASAEGAGVGLAAGAAMFGILNHHRQEATDTQVASSSEHAQTATNALPHDQVPIGYNEPQANLHAESLGTHAQFAANEPTHTQPTIEQGGSQTTPNVLEGKEPTYIPAGQDKPFIHQQEHGTYGQPPSGGVPIPPTGAGAPIPAAGVPPVPSGAPLPTAGMPIVPGWVQKAGDEAEKFFRGGVPLPGHEPSNIIPEHVKLGDQLHLDLDGDGKVDINPKVEQDASGRLFIKMSQMDTVGDGRNHEFELTHADRANHIKEKFVKVFVDHAAGDGGYLGQEIHVTTDGKEQIERTLWVGDKDRWMEEQVGADNWHHTREMNAQHSVGIDHHDTKSWGFVAREGPPAADHTYAQAELNAMSEPERQVAIHDSLPHGQVTDYNQASKEFTGHWLGMKEFITALTNTHPLSEEKIKSLTYGWPDGFRTAFKETPFGFDSHAYVFDHFKVLSDQLQKFAKELIRNRLQLPENLWQPLKGMNSESFFDALKNLKKKEFTMADLLKAAKAVAAAKKG